MKTNERSRFDPDFDARGGVRGHIHAYARNRDVIGKNRQIEHEYLLKWEQIRRGEEADMWERKKRLKKLIKPVPLDNSRRQQRVPAE